MLNHTLRLFSFLTDFQSVFQKGCISKIFTSHKQEYLLFHILTRTWCIKVSNFSHSNRYVVVSHCYLNLQFPFLNIIYWLCYYSCPNFPPSAPSARYPSSLKMLVYEEAKTDKLHDIYEMLEASHLPMEPKIYNLKEIRVSDFNS